MAPNKTMCLLSAMAMAAVGAMLFRTNPSMDEYKNYLSNAVIDVDIKGFCEEHGLPLTGKAWMEGCPQLMDNQKTNLSDLAGQFTRRIDLLFLSF